MAANDATTIDLNNISQLPENTWQILLATEIKRYQYAFGSPFFIHRQSLATTKTDLSR